MGLPLRLLLIFFSVGSAIVIMISIRRSRIQISYSIFWIIFSVFIALMAIFPQPVIWASRMLGFQSPSNLVYLAMIFLLMVKLFTTTIKQSKLDAKLAQLAEFVALQENRERGAGQTSGGSSRDKQAPGD